MPADLDAALQPDETIVYRTRGRSYSRAIVAIATILVAVPVYGVGKFAAVPTPGLHAWDLVLTVGAVTGAFGILATLFLLLAMRRQRKTPDDLIITDRRLLFSRGEWSRKIEALPLDQIDRVAWTGSHGAPTLEITAAGRVLDLPRQRHVDALARAVANASGVPPPAALGRMAVAEFWVLGAVLVWAATYSTIWLGLDRIGLLSVEDPSSLGFRMLDFGITLIALGMTWLAFELVGGILTAVIMRPLVTPEQMQAGICAGRPNRWDIRLALRWAGLLYGRPLPYLAH